jgi:hypothetical protein
MKKLNIVLSIFVGTIVMLLVFVPYYGYEKKHQSVASAQDTYIKFPPPTAYSTSIPNFSALKLQKYVNSEVSTQLINGVEMSAGNFRVENNEFNADICFQVPDSNGWTHQNVVAHFGSSELVPYGGMTFERVETLPNGERYLETFLGNPPVLEKQNMPIDGSPDYSCDTLKFRLEAIHDIPSNVTLTVYTIGGTPREGQECAASETVQSILDAEGVGIKIGCVKNNSGTQTEILEKSASMSEEEANRHISDAFQKAFVIEGPWVFQGKVTTLESP